MHITAEPQPGPNGQIQATMMVRETVENLGVITPRFEMDDVPKAVSVNIVAAQIT